MDHLHVDSASMRPVLDSGFVDLVDATASDLSVVNAARVSFGKRKDFMDESDKGLINFLMRERHGTPFEHNFLSFHIKAPIFVAREWFRHRIGWSYNEYSARYSEVPDEFYVPDKKVVRTQVGKPGSYTFDTMDEPSAIDVASVMASSCESSFMIYNALLKAGVAKELARTVLPVGTYTEFYASANARALMHFISLRGDETAQWEIRQYANILAETLDRLMPVTYASFIANGAIAP